MKFLKKFILLIFTIALIGAISTLLINPRIKNDKINILKSQSIFLGDNSFISDNDNVTNNKSIDKVCEEYNLISWDNMNASSSLEDTSKISYLPQCASDNNSSTCWVEGKEDDGIGEWIQLNSNSNVKIKSIDIENGYRKSEYVFNINNRVKKVLIEFSNGTCITKELQDGFNNKNKIEFQNKIEVKSIKFTILDVYKGIKYRDTCISEIKVFGTKDCIEESIHKSDEVLNDNEETEKDSDLVNIKDIDDTIIVDLKYAQEDNFTGKKIYESNECYLRRGTAKKLANSNKEFKKDGYTIKIYDGYRPLEVQKKFWELVPDSRYVAPPSRGSRHNRGASVDMTLVDEDGSEIEMSSKFDDFSEKASRNYKGSSEETKKNLNYLTEIMMKNGFTTITTEWWHFDDNEWSKYPIE